MRKTVRPHPILVVEGRLLLIIFALVTVALLYGIRFYWQAPIGTAILLTVFALGLWGLQLRLQEYFWQLCWGKLVLTEDAVIWRCLLCRSVKLRYEDIVDLDLRAFREGNVYRNRDRYRNGFSYLLISSKPLPPTRVDKLRSGKGLIRIHYVPRMSEALYSFLPDPYNRRFKTVRRSEK